MRDAKETTGDSFTALVQKGYTGKITETNGLPEEPLNYHESQTALHDTEKSKSSLEGASKLAIKYTNYGEYSDALRKIALEPNKTTDEILKEIHQTYQLSKDSIPDLLVVLDKKFLKSVPFSGGYMNIDWPKHLGFDKQTVSVLDRSNVLPNQWDRIGNMSGNNFTTIPSSGILYNYSKRAIPYIENPSARHIGNFNNQHYFDSIDAIRANDLKKLNKIMTNKATKSINQVQFDDMVARYRKYESDLSTYMDSMNAPYGIKGVAAPWIDDAGNVLLEGGAEQIVTPLSGAMLKEIGVITFGN